MGVVASLQKMLQRLKSYLIGMILFIEAMYWKIVSYCSLYNNRPSCSALEFACMDMGKKWGIRACESWRCIKEEISICFYYFISQMSKPGKEERVQINDYHEKHY